jgi:mono/diheme cytochrome c family protein
VGWIYFGAAWISLFIITGILSFMLTPGDWPETQDIKDGYFNPTFLPSVFIRTMGAIGLAGLYALVTASLLKEDDLRAKLIQYSARWLVPAFALLPIGVLWYFLNVPELARDLVMGATPLVLVFFLASAGLVAAIFGFAFLGSYVQPARFSFIAALFILALGLGVTGTSEWVREAVRKPFIIYDYMYSNSIRVDQAAQVKRDGVLATSKWSPIQTVTEENELEAGKEVFTLLCSACHTEDGYNALQPIVEDWPESFIRQQIEQLDLLKPIMPPFLGNQEEGDALAAWLASLGGDGRGP